MDIFVVPVLDKYLIYSPLHHFTALIDHHAVDAIRAALLKPGFIAPSSITELESVLCQPGDPAPQPRQGPVTNPFFMGLVTTRRCNLSCRYCDFQLPGNDNQVMELSIIRHAIQAYFRLAKESGLRQVEVHFFGGEPFVAEMAVHFAVEYAEILALSMDLTVRFEATTNGVYSANRCRWISKNLDTIVLSLDGPAEIQDALRPGINGQKASHTVIKNAKIFSENSSELIIRSCVTSETIHHLPQIASWIAQEFRPNAVCFEGLTPSPLSMASGLKPPDPWEFAMNFLLAEEILEQSGIQAVLSTVELHKIRDSFCPVGKDALIVWPDGSIFGCYLLEKDWLSQGLDMRLGRLVDGRFHLDPQAIQRVRNYSVHLKTLCKDCLCRFHCAGGCHINHSTTGLPGHYDDLCIQTRLVTVARLLKRLKQDDIMKEWFRGKHSLDATALQQSDTLISQVACL